MSLGNPPFLNLLLDLSSFFAVSLSRKAKNMTNFRSFLEREDRKL